MNMQSKSPTRIEAFNINDRSKIAGKFNPSSKFQNNLSKSRSRLLQNQTGKPGNKTENIDLSKSLESDEG
jgi:hypothetical protein